MAKKALEQIIQAETQAEKVVADARQNADEIRANAHTEGKAMRAEQSDALRAEKKQARINAEETAEKILAQARADAEIEAASLARSAEENLSAASALILERIRTLWQ